MLLFIGAIVLNGLFGASSAVWLKSPIGRDVVIGKCDPMIPCSVSNSECYEGMCVCKEGHLPIYKNDYNCQTRTVRNYQQHYYGTSSVNAYSCIESCLPVSEYKATCLNDAQCKPRLGKHGACIAFLNGNRGGTCGCRPPTINGGGYDGFHYAEGRCWPSRSININCNSHMDCTTENAYCEQVNMNSTESMRLYGYSSYKRCKCLKEFPVYYEPDDQCMTSAGFGEKCEFSDQCSDQLGFGAVCRSVSGSSSPGKACKCKKGHEYDKDHNKCLVAKKVAETKDD